MNQTPFSYSSNGLERFLPPKGTNGELIVESILGTRKAASRTEYLVKYVGKNFQKTKWIEESFFADSEGAESILNQAKRSNSIRKNEPFFDTDFLAIDRIIARKGDMYLVKWMKLGYNQLTVEQKVDSKHKNMFDKLEAAHYPRVENRFEGVVGKFEVQNKFPIHMTNRYLMNVPTLNLLLSNFFEEKPTELFADLGHSYAQAVAGFFKVLHDKYGVLGPFIVVLQNEALEEWYDFLRKIDNMKTIMYAYSGDAREIARCFEFKRSETMYNFHVLLTTPEIMIKDADVLNEIWWQYMVIDAKKRSDMGILRNVRSNAVINVPSLQRLGKGLKGLLEDITSEPFQRLMDSDVFDTAQATLAQLLSGNKKNKIPIELEIPKIKCQKIFVPINDVQKREIKIALTKYRKEILSGDFTGICPYILRIMTHPYINIYREYYAGVPYNEASTKITIVEYFINQFMSKEGKMLIVTEFNTIADIVEDLCAEMTCPSHRLTPKSIENEMNEAKVLICDQLHVRFSLDSALLPFFCSNVNTVIFVDGESQNVLSTLKLGMKSISAIRNAYILECERTFESDLYTLSNKPELTPSEVALAENITKKIALNVFQPTTEIEVEDIIKAEKITEEEHVFIQEALDDPDFWNLMLEENFEDESFEVSSSPPEEWSIRQRNQLIRYISGVGIDNVEPIAKLSGVRVTDEVVQNVAQQLLRFLIRFTRGNASYLRARFLLEEGEDTSIDTGMWANPSLRASLRHNCSEIFKRIDFLIHFRDELKEIKDITLSTEVPKWSATPIREQPADNWTIQDDINLMIGTLKYGFGNYDYFVTDEDPDFLELFSRNGEDIPRYMLNLRTTRLGEAIKRKREPKQTKEQVKVSSKPVKKKHYEDFDAQGEWTRKDQEFVRNVLLEKGIPLTATGERDWDTLRRNLSFNERSSEEVKEYVENYLHECEIAASLSSNKENDKEDENGSGLSIPGKTADKVLKRVKALETLQQMFLTLSDEDLEHYFSLTQDKRILPKAFTPAIEVKFLKRFAILGFGSISKILEEEPFCEVFRDANASQIGVITADYKQINRIRVLYESWQKNSKIDLSRQKVSRKLKKQVKTKSSRRIHIAITNKISVVKEHPRTRRQESQLPQQNLVFYPPIYPLEIREGVHLVNIGHVVYDRKNFHSNRYIFPVDYQIIRHFWSPTTPNEMCDWKCEILDSGSKSPLFRVTCIPDPRFTYQGYTPTMPWISLARDIKTNTGQRIKSENGTDAYLLSHPTIMHLINQLPNIDKCRNYGHNNSTYSYE